MACGDGPDRSGAAAASPTVETLPPTTAGATSPPPTTTAPVPSTTRTTASSTTMATLTVLVRGAGFCTNLPTVPDPQCDPRPLSGAEVLVRDAQGVTLTKALTGSDGVASFTLPPGAFVAVASPVTGFAETARPAAFQARAGEATRVVLTHNTGYQ